MDINLKTVGELKQYLEQFSDDVKLYIQPHEEDFYSGEGVEANFNREQNVLEFEAYCPNPY